MKNTPTLHDLQPNCGGCHRCASLDTSPGTGGTESSLATRLQRQQRVSSVTFRRWFSICLDTSSADAFSRVLDVG